jgi:hypothetical protein
VDKRKESIILAAASAGINEMFDDIRGANIFGADATSTLYNDSLTIKTNEGFFYVKFLENEHGNFIT